MYYEVILPFESAYNSENQEDTHSKLSVTYNLWKKNSITHDKENCCNILTNSVVWLQFKNKWDGYRVQCGQWSMNILQRGSMGTESIGN